MGWWVIEDSELLKLLVRCKAGEDPDMVYMEAYANSDHETAEESDLEYGTDMTVIYPDEDTD